MPGNATSPYSSALIDAYGSERRGMAFGWPLEFYENFGRVAVEAFALQHACDRLGRGSLAANHATPTKRQALRSRRDDLTAKVPGASNRGRCAAWARTPPRVRGQNSPEPNHGEAHESIVRLGISASRGTT